MAINFTRGGGFGGFTTLGRSPNNDDGRQVARRPLRPNIPAPFNGNNPGMLGSAPDIPMDSYGQPSMIASAPDVRPNAPAFFNPAEQGQVFFNPAQTKSVYSVTKRQDAVTPEPDFTGYGRSGPIFYNPSPSPSPSATPVQNAGAFHTPAFLPSNPGPPDGGGIGNLDDDIPPANLSDPTGPNIYWKPKPPPGATVQVNPNGGGGISPFGAGINPGMYNGLYSGDMNQYGNIFEGYMNGMPVFTAQTLAGAYPSSVANPSGIASNTSGGGNTGGAGQTSLGPSGFAGLFGAPVGQVAPSAAALASMFPYARMI